MTWVLIIVSLYGGIARVPMESETACIKAVETFSSGSRVSAKGYCVRSALTERGSHE